MTLLNDTSIPSYGYGLTNQNEPTSNTHVVSLKDGNGLYKVSICAQDVFSEAVDRVLVSRDKNPSLSVLRLFHPSEP